MEDELSLKAPQRARRRRLETCRWVTPGRRTTSTALAARRIGEVTQRTGEILLQIRCRCSDVRSLILFVIVSA